MDETSSDAFDPQTLRWAGVSRPKVAPRLPIPRHKAGERFLKGPIPWGWLQLAGRQPGKALHVALTLWQLVGMKRSAQVALSLSALKALGVDRFAAARGLKALERAGLVHADRRKGRKALVALLELPPVGSNGSGSA